MFRFFKGFRPAGAARFCFNAAHMSITQTSSIIV